MISKQNEDIPAMATHVHKRGGSYYCVSACCVTRYYGGRWEFPVQYYDVEGWLKFLEPIKQPTIKPQDAFIADLDKMLHQRGLDIANAIQRKLESSEGIPIEWLNELITYYGVSE